MNKSWESFTDDQIIEYGLMLAKQEEQVYNSLGRTPHDDYFLKGLENIREIGEELLVEAKKRGMIK